jgi:large subunit ribosomal protein L2
MPIKTHKPTTPSRRFMTSTDFRAQGNKKPNKALLVSKTRKVGRDGTGKISIHHRGGGHKRRYRLIDFAQGNIEKKGRITSIQYDPNRSANISEVVFENGDKAYMITPQAIEVGDTILTSAKPVEIKPGNRTILQNIPEGILVHNVEMNPGAGAALARTAGSSAKVVSHEEKYTQVQLPSGEVRRILSTCFASIGQVSNPDHSNVTIGKAGRKRWMGRRPVVRGKAKNPVDHPHGGGEGNQSIGLIHPKTPWGMPALGRKTRHKKASDRYIIRRRKKK